MHKEFYSDFLQLNNNTNPLEAGGDSYNKLLWRFQSFKTAKRKNGKQGPTGPDNKYLNTFKLKTKLCRKAKKVNEDDVQWKVTMKSKDLRALCRSNFNDIIDIQDTTTFVTEFVENGLFEDIKDLMEKNALEH